MKNKFWNFTNSNENPQEVDLYVYGDIVSGGDKWDSTDVTLPDFQQSLDNLGDAKKINMHISSMGGSVFTTQTMITMLQSVKNKGITINAYLDGTCASCASWLPMVADNIYAYDISVLMIHKPMTFAMGNANDMQKQIDVLNKMEDSIMIPTYMNQIKDPKKTTVDDFKNLLANETWLNAQEMSDLFNITILDDDKEMVAYAGEHNFLNKYKHTPKYVLDMFNKSKKQIEDKDIKDEKKDAAEKENKELEAKINNQISETEIFLALNK
ncbi:MULTISPECIES: head maturation protease, ClpP-related [Clostridium]|uniref:head maturation protease, ClpP-related n=1 Tax=Clostridium TaxID=1485 RepID=UPI000824EF27|nr:MULTISPECIES: head maturation protease, ClpP-related [Clostridium]PJI09974.1 Clp protease ClpP [Clostridium sp. CT7]